MAFNNDPDVEFEGISYGMAGKSVRFQADTWEEIQFVPLSQCEIEPLPGSDETGRCIVRIKAWLVAKNNWV